MTLTQLYTLDLRHIYKSPKLYTYTHSPHTDTELKLKAQCKGQHKDIYALASGPSALVSWDGDRTVGNPSLHQIMPLLAATVS